MHIRAGKEVSQLEMISLFLQNYQARLFTWQAVTIHLDELFFHEMYKTMYYLIY